MIVSALICDVPDCPEIFAPDERVPHGALSAQAHAEGWDSVGRNGQWKNYCPDHATEAA